MARKHEEEPRDFIDTAEDEEVQDEYEDSHSGEPAHMTHQEHAKKRLQKREQKQAKRVINEDSEFLGDKTVWAIFAVALVVLFNGFLLVNLASSLIGAGEGIISQMGAVASGTSAGGILDGKTTVGPALIAITGKPAALSGYKTSVVQMETISEIASKPKTGDRVQDAINMLIPTGTPFYGAEAGVSFDDPINSLNTWGKHERTIKLTPELQERWEKIVGSFTCDFCCGSPQNPTIINRCGCSHAASWRGIAKWMLNKYGDKYTDAQIIGEMTRWKALFYPGPMVKRAIEEGAL
ncbi:MAG: hypothetical protein HY363_06350 [Candidatus Aenigmarchaeota archaeon]|nr:hypothetical protein [Candidatus Aenigmarchaeota archaeon]